MRHLSLSGALPATFLAILLSLAATALAYDPPATDPPPTNPVDLVPALRSAHPRLLFTAADIPGMKSRLAGDSLAFYNQLLAYLPVCSPPANTSFQTNATEAQRQGFWRMPTVALHYVLTGNSTSFTRAKAYLTWLQGIDHWELGSEQDSGMAAANMMVGAALTYDWLYNDLDPTLRESFRAKLLLQARRMYYGGHLQNNADSHYWQQDAQNNHRHHRDAGLVLAALAVASPDTTDDDWILSQAWSELQFVNQWLPPDGSCHEGPTYMPFGYIYLTLATDASDRCFGTNLLNHDFFRNAARFRFLSMTPNVLDTLSYGDTNGGTGGYNNYPLRLTARHRLADEQAAFFRAYAANPNFAEFGWSSIIWHDPTVTGGSLANLPLNSYHSDLGLAYMRDGWESGGNVSAMFKCGPYGGAKLNEYRNTNGYHYINIAHDDPDAGEFVIHVANQPVARSDGYSYLKRTSGHNTILVKGVGQKGEGGQWTQPVSGDMTQMAKVLRWYSSGDVTLVEGEAGAAYTGLSRYRRTFTWVKDRYILILDDIRPTSSSELAWLVQSAAVTAVDAGANRYRLANGAATCDFQLASELPLTSTIATSTAQNQSTSLNLKQLQVRTTTAEPWRLATVFDPWQKGNLTVTLTPLDASSARVTVTGPGFEDRWTWLAAPDNLTASTVELVPPVTITSWATVANHGPAGTIATTVADNAVEPRLAGLRTFRITFSKALDPATLQTGTVTISGAGGGNFSDRVTPLALDATGTMLTVTLTSPLPDDDVYTVTVGSAVRAADGAEPARDLNLIVKALAGDVNGSGLVNLADVLALRAAVGQPLSAATARHDLDGSGSINNGDLQAVRANLGHSLP